MDFINSQFMSIMNNLMPGFITSVIFYWLSISPKPSQFERIIYAIICSAFISLLVGQLSHLLIWIGGWYSFGKWSEGAELLWSVIFAFSIGLCLARCEVTNSLYDLAKNLGLTSRDAVLTFEWEYAFTRYAESPVVLNLLDGRRLMGFPKAWPNNHLTGHFLIEQASWLDGETVIPCDGISAILIGNCDVQWVEFLGDPQETL